MGVPSLLGHHDPNLKNIKGNKQLVRDFLESVQTVFAEGREINVTLKISTLYDKRTFPDFVKYRIEPKSQYFSIHSSLLVITTDLPKVA